MSTEEQRKTEAARQLEELRALSELDQIRGLAWGLDNGLFTATDVQIGLHQLLAAAKHASHSPIIDVLRTLNTKFYWMCFVAGVGARAHSFIEFNGLMSKHIDLLSRAVDQGIDLMLVNEHNGVQLPIEEHDMTYLGEKLRCILGPVLDGNPAARAALKRSLFGEG